MAPASAAAGLRHLVLVKFKEGADAEPLLRDLDQLSSQIQAIKSLEWGEDVFKHQVLGHGFTHAIILTFESDQDFADYIKHPTHVDFGKRLRAVTDDLLVIDFTTTRA